MASKLFVFTHGVGGSPKSCFIPFMRTKLEEAGQQTLAPEYKNSDDPDFDDWKATFNESLASAWNKVDPIVLVGHSLGGYFVLRLLGESAETEWAQKLVGVVLVAPTSMKRPERRKFYSEEVQWDNILKLKAKIIMLYSDNDEKVAPMHSELVVSKIGSMPGFEFRQPKGFNHFIMPEAEPVTEAIMCFVNN